MPLIMEKTPLVCKTFSLQRMSTDQQAELSSIFTHLDVNVGLYTFDASTRNGMIRTLCPNKAPKITQCPAPLDTQKKKKKKCSPAAHFMLGMYGFFFHLSWNNSGKSLITALSGLGSDCEPGLLVSAAEILKKERSRV